MVLAFQQFLMCFAFLLVAGYLAPAGILHWFVHVSPTAEIELARIQSRRPRRGDVAREVRQSLVALGLFAVYCVPLLWAYEAGLTAVYWDVWSYPLWWLPLSVVAAAVLHDTWFYWTHRVMHLPGAFRLMHAGHHKSLTPTPWAILSFDPLETVPQFAFFALLIWLVPMHPAALFAYLMFDGLANAAGHCGHELVPRSLRLNRRLWFLAAVGHHDLHHSRFNRNFGQYFTVWDRLMGTHHDPHAQAGSMAVEPEPRKQSAS